MEETYNFSEKVNPFKNTTDNCESFERQFHSITNVVTVFLCSCAVLADVILIVFIISLKNLRCLTNYYVMHFAVFNCLYFVVTPPFFMLFEQTVFSSYYNSKFLCSLLQTERTCLSFCFLFTFGLCLQWLVSSFNTELGHTFSKVLKYLPYVLYVIGVVKFFVAVGLCYTKYSEVAVRIHDSIYLITFLFCTTIHFVNYKYSFENSDYLAGIICNTIIFCWFPFYIYKYVYKLSLKISEENYFKSTLELGKFLFDWPAYASSLGLFIVFCFETELISNIFRANICKASKSYKVADRVENFGDGDDNLIDDIDENNINSNVPIILYV